MRTLYARVFAGIREELEPRLKGRAVFENSGDRDGVRMIITAPADVLKNAGLPLMDRGDQCRAEFCGTNPDSLSGDISLRFNGGLPVLIQFYEHGQLRGALDRLGERDVARDFLGSLSCY